MSDERNGRKKIISKWMALLFSSRIGDHVLLVVVVCFLPSWTRFTHDNGHRVIRMTAWVIWATQRHSKCSLVSFIWIKARSRHGKGTRYGNLATEWCWLRTMTVMKQQQMGTRYRISSGWRWLQKPKMFTDIYIGWLEWMPIRVHGYWKCMYWSSFKDPFAKSVYNVLVTLPIYIQYYRSLTSKSFWDNIVIKPRLFHRVNY